MSLKCLTRVLTIRRVLSSITDMHVTQRVPTLSRHYTVTRVGHEEEDEEEEGKKAKKQWRYEKREGVFSYRPVPVEYTESMEYLESDGYATTYGKDPVWKQYRRNFSGHYPPPTRHQCIRAGHIATGSACPVCRDDYLVLDYRNLKLLKQFVYEHTSEPLPTSKTGICQQQYKRLVIEVAKAKDRGLLEAYIPYRDYNYDDYRKVEKKSDVTQESSS